MDLVLYLLQLKVAVIKLMDNSVNFKMDTLKLNLDLIELKLML